MSTLTLPTEQQYKAIEREFTRLLKSLKADICDDYRATDDPDDNQPGMCVTFGVNWKDGELTWSYQPGDNSYTGGAYGCHHWGVVYLYRRSRSAELASDAVEQIADSIAQSGE